MAKVKLVGGIADGAVALVDPDVDVIYVPKAWVRNGLRRVPLRASGIADDMAKYVRLDDETFVPER